MSMLQKVTTLDLQGSSDFRRNLQVVSGPWACQSQLRFGFIQELYLLHIALSGMKCPTYGFTVWLGYQARFCPATELSWETTCDIFSTAGGVRQRATTCPVIMTSANESLPGHPQYFGVRTRHWLSEKTPPQGQHMKLTMR